MRFRFIELIVLLNLLSLNLFSQSYTLKQNIVHISECAHPQNGFVLTGKTTTENANSDSFSLDINSRLFKWTDNKGTSTQKIYNYQSKSTDLKTQCFFATESNSIRITSNQQKDAVIEIICLIKERWYCLSYLCTITNF